MEFDRLSEVWRRADVEPRRLQEKELAMIQERSLAFDRKIRLRGTMETVAAAIVAVCFTQAALNAGLPLLTRAGAVVMVLGALFIPFWLWRAYRRRPRLDASVPMAAMLARELDRVRVQIRLLRSVAWWYSVPFSAGGVLFCLGLALAPIWGKLAPGTAVVVRIAYVLLFPVVAAGVWWVNQYVVKTQLRPREKEIEEQLASINPSSSESTNM